MKLATPALLAMLAAIPVGAAEPPAKNNPGLIDPFYLSLQKDGIQSFEDGRPAQATQMLRLACFGMLESPQTLSSCLIRLGAAQGRSDDRAAFIDTFRRLAETEERFATYEAASAAVPAEVKVEFEGFLVRWIAEEQLADLAVFEPLATRRIVAKLRRLPPVENRKELETLVAAQPGVLTWRVALADLELDLDRLDAASKQLEAIFAVDAGLGPAHCLGGRLAEKKGDCTAASASFARCTNLIEEPVLVEALLSCLVKTGDGSQARATLARLPAEWLTERRFERLARQIEKMPATPPQAIEAASDLPRVEPHSERNPESPLPPPTPAASPTPEATAAAAAVASSLPEELARQAAELRQQVSRVQFASELAGPWAAADSLANNHPQQPELQFLAAEIAYRSSRWQDAVRYFERGGDPGDSRPVMLFYWAISLYESGDREGAQTVFERALPRLKRTPLVEAYRTKILPAEPGQEPANP